MTNFEIIEENYFEATKGIESEWLDSGGAEWYNYVTNLPEHLKNTYLIMVLHSQVMNGGFHQYFFNGYGQFAKETIVALNSINALKKARSLKESLRIVNFESHSDEDFRNKVLIRKLESALNDDDISDLLNEIDNSYYNEDQEENLEYLLGTYLKAVT